MEAANNIGTLVEGEIQEHTVNGSLLIADVAPSWLHFSI